MLIALGAGLGSVGGGWRVAGLAVSLAALLASGGTLIVLMRVRADLLALVATAESVARGGEFAERFRPTATGGELAALRGTLNHLLDVADAFVREAGASMQQVAQGTYYRKILLRGLPGDFRTSAERVNAATDEMEALVATTREIGVVLTLIGDIADKTNLLALNATTEAARAVRPQSRPKYSRRQAVVGPLT